MQLAIIHYNYFPTEQILLVAAEDVPGQAHYSVPYFQIDGGRGVERNYQLN